MAMYGMILNTERNREMTKSEYRKMREQYVILTTKKKIYGLTELEDALCNYYDKIITYVDLRQTAVECGNKNPDDNFLIKNAKERMMKAKEKLEGIAK